MQTSKLTGYGGGSKFTKADVDRIMHALVFENVLEESSQQAGASGYAADYVQPGSQSQAVLSGNRQVFIRFAKKTAPQKKATKKKKETTTKAKGKKKTKKSAKTVVEVEDFDDFLDDSPKASAGSKRPSSAGSGVLSSQHTSALRARIKKLVTMWADEVSIVDDLIDFIIVTVFKPLSFHFHMTFTGTNEWEQGIL